MTKQKKTKKKNKGGRPRKYRKVAALQKKINEYFVSGVTKRKVVVGPATKREVIEIEVPTITGLILFCGFCNRASFYDLENDPKFSNTIKKARSRIEQVYEEQLHTASPTGAIFALKNFDWKDTKELSGPDGKPVTFRVVYEEGKDGV